MSADDEQSHLSRIETRWTLVFEAHAEGSRSPEALRDLMRRYGGAVRRYLMASLRDPEAAGDLAQEFALRFLRGDFRNADPGKGRFRDFVKRAVANLMNDHHRARRSRPSPLVGEVAGPGLPEDFDTRFGESWRDELMSRAWAALRRSQERSGGSLYDALRVRVDRPELSTEALAGALSERLGRPVDANWARVAVHRARDRYVEALIDEVAASLDDPTPERVEQELIDVGLFEQCRRRLRRRRGA